MTADRNSSPAEAEMNASEAADFAAAYDLDLAALTAAPKATETPGLREAGELERELERQRKRADHNADLYWKMRGKAEAAEMTLSAHDHPDDLAVDRFAAFMKSKLAEKRAEGRHGWDDQHRCSAATLSRLLREHVEKGDPVDVGNFAMMLHQRGEAIVAPENTEKIGLREAAAPNGVASVVDFDEIDTLFRRIPSGPYRADARGDGWEVRQIDADPTNRHHWPFRLCQSIAGQKAGCDDATFGFIAAILNVWPTISAALSATPQPVAEEAADRRYPSMFYSPDRQHRVGVSHYEGLPTVTVATLLENKPGGQWVEVELAPDEAKQMALHLLEKVASARATPQPVAVPDDDAGRDEVEEDHAKEVERASEEGFNEGYEEGLAEGRRDARSAHKGVFHFIYKWLDDRGLIFDEGEGINANDVEDGFHLYKADGLAIERQTTIRALEKEEKLASALSAERAAHEKTRRERSAIASANARQASCLHQIAQSIDPEASASMDGTPRRVKAIVAEVACLKASLEAEERDRDGAIQHTKALAAELSTERAEVARLRKALEESESIIGNLMRLCINVAGWIGRGLSETASAALRDAQDDGWRSIGWKAYHAGSRSSREEGK